MKKIIMLLVLTFGFGFALTSCDVIDNLGGDFEFGDRNGDGNRDRDRDGNGDGDGNEDGDKQDRPCFTLIYPVTHIMPDGSLITADSKEEMDRALKAWHEANPDVRGNSKMQFPVEVELEAGTIKTINSSEEMAALRMDCFKNNGDGRGGDKGDKDGHGDKDRDGHGDKDRDGHGDKNRDDKMPCFTMLFPVTHIMPDGSLITANSKEELDRALKAWHRANPDSNGKSVRQFPFDVKLADGTIKTINGEDEFNALRKDCMNNNGRGGDKDKKDGHGDNDRDGEDDNGDDADDDNR